MNSENIREDLVKKYAEEENKEPVKITDLSKFKEESFKVIERDLVNEDDYIRHDPSKVATVIADFVEGWIK